MRVQWGKIPEGVLDPKLRLGSDIQALADAGQFAEVRKRALKWQRLIGRPGDKVRQKLAAACALQAAPDGAVGGTGATLADTRVKLADTLTCVTRAYLLSTRFVFGHYWMLDDLVMARFVHDFLADSRKYGREHNLEVETSFQAPIRSIGSLGWTGSAKLRCVGTAGELQQFVDKVCRLGFVGLEPSSIRDAFMEEIPTFAQARAADGYVQLTDEQLLSELSGSVTDERREHSAALRRSMDELQQMVEAMENRERTSEA